MLGKKWSIYNAVKITASILLLASTAFAQEADTALHSKQPHPPTTRPPELSERMRAGISPLPYTPSQAIQQPVQDAQVANHVQQMPATENMVRQTRPAPIARPTRSIIASTPIIPPEAAKPVVAKTTVETHPEQPTPEATPSDFSGYIVFVAGVLLLCRKTED